MSWASDITTARTNGYEIKNGWKDTCDINDGYHSWDTLDWYYAWDPETEEYVRLRFDIANVGNQWRFGDNIDSSLRPFNDGSSGGFKFFIPPGTVYANAECYNEGMTGIEIAMRYKTPPTSFPSPISQDTFAEGEYISLIELIEDDHTMYLGNANGHTIFLSGGVKGVGYYPTYWLTEEEAGWMYGVAYTNKTAIATIYSAFKVKRDVYTDWYDNYDWDVDSFGLQTQINECEGYPT